MAFSASLDAVEYFTDTDTYHYTTDNRPLTDLAARDVQLANELDRRTYAGDITGAATCTVNHLPTGWSVATNGTGDYTITHNLGSTAYIVTGCIQGATVGVFFVVSQGTNTVEVKTTNISGTLTHLRFNMLLTGY